MLALVAAGAASLPASPALAGEPAPRFRETFVAEPVSGVVRVYVLNRGYRTLRGRTVLRVPSLLDTRRGEVRLTLDTPSEEVDETAVVGEGEFLVHQDLPTETTGARTRLRLIGAGIDACPPRWMAQTARKARRKLRIRKRSGRIVTDDRFSITGGEGTEWRVTEECEFTRIDVEEGVVLSVPKEEALAGLREFLLPGDMMTFGCDAGPRFCTVAIVTRRPGADGALDDIILAAAVGPLADRQLNFCVTPPRGATACAPFEEVVIDGERGWFVGCIARAGPGRYRFRWATVRGERFGPVLPLEIRNPEPPPPDGPASCGRPEEGR